MEQKKRNSQFPKVSVVTATYKRFDNLFVTMESVFLQDYLNIEYIICDDGSPDFPKSEIESFIKKKNIKGIDVLILESAENRGTVRNLNNAYKKSSGSYVFNLSSGDVFFSVDTVTRLVERFKKTNCKVLAASRILYENRFQPLCLLPHLEERGIISEMDTKEKQYAALVASRYYDMASGSSMYFSRDILEELGYFDERYVLWEDGPFLAKYLYKYKLEFAYDIISIWYEEGGVSSSARKKRAKNALLKNDVEFFNKNERKKHINMLDKADRRRIECICKRSACRNYYDRAKVYLRYFTILAGNIITGYKREKRVKRDELYIRELLNSDKEKVKIIDFRERGVL